MILYRPGHDCSRDTFLDFIDGRSFAHRMRIRAGDVSEKWGNQGQLCGKIKCHLWRWRSLAESNRSLRRERERAAIEGGSSPAALIAIAQWKAFEAYSEMTVRPGACLSSCLREPKALVDLLFYRNRRPLAAQCQTTEALTPN